LPNRLGLAHWLVDAENPLTARVTVNRFWEQFFGRGLVETAEDFGIQGERPSHPELLDWLATEFVRLGWSQKALHRTIVLSAAYRQSSRVTPLLLEKDPYNRLLSRGPRFRMEAEMVRDSALAAGGLLCRRIGGPSVFPYQPDGVWKIPFNKDQWINSDGDDRYRRGLYTFWRRTSPYPSFMTFDAPSREVCSVKRVRTNTPLQALVLLNDPAFFDAARGMARRVMTEAGPEPSSRAVHAFRRCTARAPGEAELREIVALHALERERFRKDADAARRLVQVPSGESDLSEWAAWTVVCNTILNLDETITKE
jgi:hypothetical protein